MKLVWFISVLIVNVAIVTTIFYTTNIQATAFLIPALSAMISIGVIIISPSKIKKHIGWLTLLASVLSIPMTYIVCFVMIAFGGGMGPS